MNHKSHLKVSSVWNIKNKWERPLNFQKGASILYVQNVEFWAYERVHECLCLCLNKWKACMLTEREKKIFVKFTEVDVAYIALS